MIRAAAIWVALVAAVGAEVPASIRAEMIPVAQCWNLGGPSPVAALTAVTVACSLTPQCNLVSDSLRMIAWDGNSAEAAEEFCEAARRTILCCGKAGFDLTQGQSDAWKDLEMTFDLRRMKVS